MAQPSPNFGTALKRASDIANEVIFDQLGGATDDPAARARQHALSNISEFYRLRRDPKPNLAYLDQTSFRHATPQDQIALHRQNSFLSVSDTFDDIRALAFTPAGEPEPYMEWETVDVLDQSILTVNLLSKALQEAAVARAVAGERALPLTLDKPRINAFIRDHEATLEQVIRACAGGVVEPDQLVGPVRTLATDYFRRNNLLPSGLTPGTNVDFRNIRLRNEPVSVFIDKFPDSAGEVLINNNTLRDQVVVSLGSAAVSGPLQRYDSVIPGFATRPPAEKRAAIVLQGLFQALTVAEERIQGEAIHARTAEERRKAQGTKKEHAYAGSAGMGDCTQPDAYGMSQRLRATMPLRALSQHQVQGSSNITNPGLAEWLGSAQFNMDMGVITDPALRLGMAQVGQTANALLQSRAFGGAGL